jgi:hypothetical protein
VKGAVVRREEVDAATRNAMYELFCTQFDNVSFRSFVADLEQKNWVLLLRTDEDVLTGFSSMHLYDVTVEGRELAVVYSGDTVVDSETWSDSALSYYWMGAIDYLRRLHRKERLYWFLLVSGYRTYRFLPVYSEYFFPRYDQATPDDVRTIMDTLAKERFGEQYDENSGVVRLKSPSILRGKYRGIPENRMSDPHIAFFAKRNPGHEEGDELACFSILAADRLTRLGRRMWARGRKLFPDSPDE